MEKLKVGDVLYNNRSNPSNKVTIESVTATQAKGNGVRMKRDTDWGGYKDIGGSDINWFLGNDELEAAYQRRLVKVKEMNDRYKMIDVILNIRALQKLSTDQLTRIFDILNEKV